MDARNVYLVLVVVVLLGVVAALVLAARRGQAQRLTPLGGLALAFVVAGIVFGESRLVGYGLFAVGIGLAVVDIVRRSRRE